LVRQTFYGLRVHVRLEWPGVMTRVCIAPANVSELAALPALAEGTVGLLVGDRTYWSPKTTAEWQAQGVELLAPYRSAKRDPYPRWSALLSRVRYASTPSSANSASGVRSSACGRVICGI
jgi:Transposase DDE domain